ALNVHLDDGRAVLLQPCREVEALNFGVSFAENPDPAGAVVPRLLVRADADRAGAAPDVAVIEKEGAIVDPGSLPLQLDRNAVDLAQPRVELRRRVEAIDQVRVIFVGERAEG